MANIFTSLSTYHPKPPATPFEVYCLRGLTHLVEDRSEALAELLGLGTAAVAGEVQAAVGPGLYADTVFSAGGESLALLETAVEAPTAPERLDMLAKVDGFPGARVYVGLGEDAPDGWSTVSWATVADALAQAKDPVERQFAEFIRRDILGLGPATLHDATGSNRFFAMGSAVVRDRFGLTATYENGASPPIGGEFRYLGTMFAPDGADQKSCWIGLVNETVPLGGGYRLMMASRDTPISSRHDAPRDASDWNWNHWTDMGPVSGEITRHDMAAVLDRLQWREV